MFQKFRKLVLRLIKGSSKTYSVDECNKQSKRIKELENQVDESAVQLELAKASFLKNLYHEIRTPLNAIIGFTNLLSKDTRLTREDRDEYLVLINKSSTEFLRIMDDIIQASLLEADMIQINYEVCNLGDFLNELHAYFSIRKHVLEKNDIAFLKNVPEQFVDVFIECDKYRIIQILSQLIENAFKYTNKGTIEYGFSKSDNFLQFYVKDTGSGIPDDRTEFIFNRFSKIDDTDNSKNGLGLGLSISKRLVELMGGKIWYSSNETKGSCFYFTIPLMYAKPIEVNGGDRKEETLIEASEKSFLKNNINS